MNKRMRNLLTTLLVLALCVGVVSPMKVLAEENSYRLEAMELEMTIPTGYTAITRDTPENDPIFDEIGMLQSDLIAVMESGNIYMEIFPEDFTEEIVVTMQPNDFPTFSWLSDEQLTALGDEFLKTDLGTQYGVDIDYFAYDIYQHAQTKFLIEYFTDSTNSVYGLQYYTIYDGKAMNFTLRSYVGPITENQEAMMETLVDSVKYDGMEIVSEVTQISEAFVYTNDLSGVSFTVPENWIEEEFYKEKEILDVKFVHSMDGSKMIMFGAVDAWSEMSEVDKIGHNRTDFNASLFSLDDAAMIYGLTGEEISKVTYNGKEYFKGEISQTGDVYGLEMEVTQTILFNIENGWMYSFQFNGTDEDELYADFEKLMNSVEYPENAGTISATTKENAIKLVVPIAILIFVLVVIVLKVNRKKQSNNTDFEYNPLFAENNLVSATKEQDTVFCRNCGKELPKDSAFCHHCGTQIIE